MSKSKSENCQDNFRDLLRFILSFWVKSNILCRVGFKYNLFVDPSLRRGLLLVRLFSPNTVEKRFDSVSVVHKRARLSQYLDTPLRMTRLNRVQRCPIRPRTTDGLPYNQIIKRGIDRYFREGRPLPYSLSLFFVCRGGVSPPVV